MEWNCSRAIEFNIRHTHNKTNNLNMIHKGLEVAYKLINYTLIVNAVSQVILLGNNVFLYFSSFFNMHGKYTIMKTCPSYRN